MEFAVIPEPDCYFGKNRPCIDPQVGLLNFGPHGGMDPELAAPRRIVAGAIGTERSIRALEFWLRRLGFRINDEKKHNSSYQHISFPGLSMNGPLRFDVALDNGAYAILDPALVKRLEADRSRKRRIWMLTEEYVRCFDTLKEARPEIVFLPLDDELLRITKDPRLRTDRIRYQTRSFGDKEDTKGEGGESEIRDAQVDDQPDEAEGMFDFHNYLKAQAAIRGFTTQMLQPDTLTFAENRQTAAVIGWNIAVAVYYKATGIPWKLADIDDRTCYVGISFYQDLKRKGGVMRACVAQVYMRTGESQVIRGEPFRWDPYQSNRYVHLTAAQMEEIVSGAIKLYREQRHTNPERVVVHKKTKFYEEEMEGVQKGAGKVEKLDVVHISGITRFRAYHIGEDYPVVRGTFIGRDNHAMLYTSGLVPALGTFLGPAVPAPLRLIGQRLDTSIAQVSKDIMGLTKLDWNSSAFSSRMPVTLSVPHKVGAVMAEMAVATPTPPSSYKHYM